MKHYANSVLMAWCKEGIVLGTDGERHRWQAQHEGWTTHLSKKGSTLDYITRRTHYYIGSVVYPLFPSESSSSCSIKSVSSEHSRRRASHHQQAKVNTNERQEMKLQWHSAAPTGWIRSCYQSSWSENWEQSCYWYLHCKVKDGFTPDVKICNQVLLLYFCCSSVSAVKSFYSDHIHRHCIAFLLKEFS